MLGVISGFFTGAKVWLSFIKINPESKIWNKHCLEIWFFFLLNEHIGVCTAYSFLTWKPPGLVCYIYDITGNDVHFVLDIKTVHLHWPFPCVSPQNFIFALIVLCARVLEQIKIIEYQWFSESSGLSYMCSSPSLSSLSAWNNAPGLTNSLFHSIVWLEFYIKRV